MVVSSTRESVRFTACAASAASRLFSESRRIDAPTMSTCSGGQSFGGTSGSCFGGRPSQCTTRALPAYEVRAEAQPGATVAFEGAHAFLDRGPHRPVRLLLSLRPRRRGELRHSTARRDGARHRGSLRRYGTAEHP